MSEKPCTLCVGCGRCETYSKDIDVLTKGGLPHQVTTFPCDVFGQIFTQGEMLVCVDIGTTTVAMTLRKLADGQVMDTFTALNPQGKFGSDVISRMEKQDAHEQMKCAIEEVICRGICQFEEKLIVQEDATRTNGNLVGQPHGQTYTIQGIVVTGNTTMLYLLQGLSTVELSVAPFYASHTGQKWTKIRNLDTLLMPGISAFVGADVLAGMFALSMDEALGREVSETRIFQGAVLLDLGTNGEMVYAGPEGLVATATPAAPAYEGGNFGEQIYGADYVSLLAYLLKEGYMDETGLLADPYFEDGIVVAGKRITQQDIRRLQLAKAATRAGLQILTKETMSSVVYLAGGFGYYLDGKKAEQIGLLPAGFGEKSVAVGNLALEGAFLYGQSQFAKTGDLRLVSAEIQEEADKLSSQAYERIYVMKERTKVLNLALEPGFEKVYLESMNFPKGR